MDVVILRTAHGVCLLLLSDASLLPVFFRRRTGWKPVLRKSHNVRIPSTLRESQHLLGAGDFTKTGKSARPTLVDVLHHGRAFRRLYLSDTMSQCAGPSDSTH
jgi:hypothetical protein